MASIRSAGGCGARVAAANVPTAGVVAAALHCSRCTSSTALAVGQWDVCTLAPAQGSGRECSCPALAKLAVRPTLPVPTPPCALQRSIAAARCRSSTAPIPPCPLATASALRTIGRRSPRKQVRLLALPWGRSALPPALLLPLLGTASVAEALRSVAQCRWPV